MKITCPYCFSDFNDDEVHFRFRYLAEQQLKQRTDIPDQQRKPDDLYVDSRYQGFWKAYGRTSERVKKGVHPSNIPVYNPKDNKDFFAEGKDPLIRQNGMVTGAVSNDGTEVTERVCPICHNPLPGLYGMNPVKFIPVIGSTASGKTVFLSQLCKYIYEGLEKYGLTASYISSSVTDYLEDNCVEEGHELPYSSPVECLIQPLFIDIINNEKKIITIAFYDIAGENCTNELGMNRFGNFIEHSDGMILLIPPQQLNANKGSDSEFYSDMPSAVLNTIFNAFHYKKNIQNVPLAVCISQSDRVAKTILGQEFKDVTVLTDLNGNPVSRFNADEYNITHEKIMSFIKENCGILLRELENMYDDYNFFLVSALGTGVSYEDHKPDGPTVPIRIMEPFAWLLTKFNFLEVSGFVYQPEDWTCPVCGKRYHNSPDSLFCTEHLINADGFWKCNYCSTDTNIRLNPDSQKWCECKRDRFGRKKGPFGGLLGAKK